MSRCNGAVIPADKQSTFTVEDGRSVLCSDKQSAFTVEGWTECVMFRQAEYIYSGRMDGV